MAVRDIRVFVSYAREDARDADALAAVLEREGFAVFVDRRRMRAGEFAPQLEQAIRDCDVFVLLLSPASARSTYVRRELHVAADDFARPVLPVMLEDADLSRFRLLIAGLQIHDLTARSDAQYAEVVDGVYRARASGPEHRPDPGRWLRVLGGTITAVGLVVLLGAMGYFFLQLIETADAGLGDPTPSGRPFAVAMAVFFVGMVIAGIGQGIHRAGRRR